MGKHARRRRRPAAGLGPLGREVLDARHDGDRPQRRPQRRVGARVWPAQRRRALRLRLLPPPHPDVRQHRARRRAPSVVRRRRSTRLRRPRAPTSDLDLDADDLRELVERSRRSSRSTTGRDFPQDPREQLDLAVRAVFDSWNTDRAPPLPAPASTSRRTSAPPSTCRRWCSATSAGHPASGVAFTRDPAPRRAGRVRRLPAERPGRGRRRRYPQHRLAGRPGRGRPPAPTGRPSMAFMTRPESAPPRHGDIEFTVNAPQASGRRRPASASAPPPRRSGSPSSWSTRP